MLYRVFEYGNEVFCLFSISFVIFGQLVFIDLFRFMNILEYRLYRYHVAECHHHQIKHNTYTILLEVLYRKRASCFFESMTTGMLMF